MESWKEIVKLSRRNQPVKYKVSNTGRVMICEQYIERPNGNGTLLQKEKELAYHRDDCGYIRCSAGKVHRLVAEAFIPNLNNKETVNHKNAIKDDNRLYNLEWATRKEQTNHFYGMGIKCKSIEVNGILFNGANEAGKFIGCSGNAVRLAIKENRKCKGYAVRKRP